MGWERRLRKTALSAKREKLTVLKGTHTSELAASKKMTRKFWSAAQKQQIVEEANVAGASAAEVALRHDVRLALLTACIVSR